MPFAHRWRRPDGTRATELDALPESETEVRVLAAMFGSGGTFLVQEEASERAFKERAGDFAVIHIGTHSNPDLDHPMLSSLLLSPDTVSGEDGDLMGYEIAEMDLSANLVVLSSCANLVGGDGIDPGGIIRGFLEAGVPSLIGTAWDIDDTDARSFMKIFYGELLAGASVSAALQRAKIAFMRTVGSQPRRWGPYMLVGNPDVTMAVSTQEDESYPGSFRVALTMASLLALVLVSWKAFSRARAGKQGHGARSQDAEGDGGKGKSEKHEARPTGDPSP